MLLADRPAFQRIHELARSLQTFPHHDRLLAHYRQGILEEPCLILYRRRRGRHGVRSIRQGIGAGGPICYRRFERQMMRLISIDVADVVAECDAQTNHEFVTAKVEPPSALGMKRQLLYVFLVAFHSWIKNTSNWPNSPVW